METPHIKVIITDDHHIFADGLVSLLKKYEHIKIAGVALNGHEVLEMLEKDENVDIVITDISMAEMDGIELNSTIKKKFPKVSTLVLSMHNDPDKIEKLIKHDVNGYLLKNTELDELLQAINSIVKGENYFSASVKQKYTESLFSREKEHKTNPELSRREIDVLKLIAKEHIAQEIADILCISQHTVDTHRKNMLSKLNLRNTAGLVRYAIENGLVD